MSEWKEVRATDFCVEVTDGTHDSPKPVSKGKYLLTSKHLQEYQLDFANAYKISQEDYEKVITRSKVEQFDVLFSMIGTVGIIHRVTIKEVDFAVKNMGIFKIGGDDIKSKWLYYWLKTRKAKEYINSCLSGTTQGYLTLKALRNFPIQTAPEETMKSIASILSSFDDKIAINRKICANLEAQAQALFKHWFIDFAPFKDGKFVDSELGMIPEGWKVGTLMQIADYLNGLAMQKFPPKSEDDAIPVLKIKELGQACCDSNSDKCTKQIKPEYVVKDGDVVFSWSGTLLVDLWCGGICGLNQHLFKVTSETYPKWFYLMWTKYHLNEFIRIAKDKAVTMGHIKRGDLEKALVTIPDNNTLNWMSNLMNEIIDKIISTRLENLSLSSLRDTLLPKLMSGEIKV